MSEIVTGIDFNFTYAPGITEEQILGVELAGEMWSNYLGDTHYSIDKHDVVRIENTKINIHVEIDSGMLPENVIGGAFPAIVENKYQDIYDGLTKDSSTINDELAVDSLLNNKKTNVVVNGEVIENDKMQLTTANLKALDFIDVSDAKYQELDGYIVLSDLSKFDSVEWNYDYLGETKPNTLDFLSTITHEIGHTLGFISGTDRVALTTEALGYYQSFAVVDAIEQALSIKDNGGYFVEFDKEDGKIEVEEDNNDIVDFEAKFKNKDEDKFLKNEAKFLDYIEILRNYYNSENNAAVDAKAINDAFKAVDKYLKYDENWKDYLEGDEFYKIIKDSLDLKKLAKKMTSMDLFRYSADSLAKNANELTRGVATYFSLDGLQTDIAMSNGKDYQGSHWQDRELTDGLGVMNPTVALDERWAISQNDLMALDAIGWDVSYSQPVDMQTLYEEALAAVGNAWIGDRDDDVKKIVEDRAYDARRTSRSTTSRYNMMSDAYFASTGYFSTFSPSTEALGDTVVEEVLIDNYSDLVNDEFDFIKLAEVGENLTIVNNDFINLQQNNESNRQSTLLDEMLKNFDRDLSNDLEINLVTEIL